MTPINVTNIRSSHLPAANTLCTNSDSTPHATLTQTLAQP